MTVSTELSHEEYVGNGVTTDFDFRFRIFESKHLIVVVADSDGNETTLKNGTDYTIVGAGSFHGGKVVLNKPLAKGWKILLERDLPVVQETDLRNQGKFFAEVHEDAFDYLTMLIQKALGTFTLSLRKPTYLSNYYDAKGNRIANLASPKLGTDAVNKDYVDNSIKYIDSKTLRVNDKHINALPNTEQRANKILAFDDNGQPITVLPESGSASDVLIELAKLTGASLIGASNGNNIQQELDELSKDVYSLKSLDTLNDALLYLGNDEYITVNRAKNGSYSSSCSRWKKTSEIGAKSTLDLESGCLYTANGTKYVYDLNVLYSEKVGVIPKYGIDNYEILSKLTSFAKSLGIKTIIHPSGNIETTRKYIHVVPNSTLSGQGKWSTVFKAHKDFIPNVDNDAIVQIGNYVTSGRNQENRNESSSVTVVNLTADGRRSGYIGVSGLKIDMYYNFDANMCSFYGGTYNDELEMEYGSVHLYSSRHTRLTDCNLHNSYSYAILIKSDSTDNIASYSKLSLISCSFDESSSHIVIKSSIEYMDIIGCDFGAVHSGYRSDPVLRYCVAAFRNYNEINISNSTFRDSSKINTKYGIYSANPSGGGFLKIKSCMFNGISRFPIINGGPSKSMYSIEECSFINNCSESTSLDGTIATDNYETSPVCTDVFSFSRPSDAGLINNNIFLDSSHLNIFIQGVSQTKSPAFFCEGGVLNGGGYFAQKKITKEQRIRAGSVYNLT